MAQSPTPQTPRGELPIMDHIMMVNDLSRAEAFCEALHASIRPGDVVLEVGTGAGLLSCLAARLGAKHVYTVERSPALYEVAKKVFAANRLSDKITILNVGSEELHALKAIPEPANVFVTETIGALGVDEGIVPIFDHVRALLAPDAKVIPRRMRFKQCLVNMSGIRERMEVIDPILGVDLSALNDEVRSNLFFWLNPIEPWREVSTVAETCTYDLMDFKPEESLQEMTVVRDNMCDGMLTWSEFELTDDIRIDTRYRQLGNSWANAVHMMKRLAVRYPQRCRSEFRLSDDRVTWNVNWHIDPPAHGREP